MKKLINKALLYRDWKYSKWFIPILILELSWIYVPEFFQRNQYGRLSINQFMDSDKLSGATIILSLTLMVMASVLFSFDRNSASYSFAASMPFNRREITLSKWLVGFYNIFFAWFSVYVIENILLILNHVWGEYFVHITYNFIVNLLVLFFILGFFLMLHSINGTVFVGSLISLVFAAVPSTFIYLLDGIYTRYDKVYIVPSFIKNSFYFIMKLLGMIRSFVGLSVIGDMSSIHIPGLGEMGGTEEYIPYWTLIKIVLYIATIVLMFIISSKLFEKSRLELNGRITTVESCNKLYKTIIAFYAGFLMHTILLMITGEIAFRPDIVIIFCIIIPVPVYFLTGRVVKIYNRRFA